MSVGGELNLLIEFYISEVLAVHQPFGGRERRSRRVGGLYKFPLKQRFQLSICDGRKETGFYGGQSLRLERSEANEGDVPRFPFELALGDLADSTGLRSNWCCIVTGETSEK